MAHRSNVRLSNGGARVRISFANISNIGHVQSLHDAPFQSCLYTSAWLQTAVDLWVNTLRAVITAWMNSSQRSRVGVGMNRSARVCVCIAI